MRFEKVDSHPQEKSSCNETLVDKVMKLFKMGFVYENYPVSFIRSHL